MRGGALFLMAMLGALVVWWLVHAGDASKGREPVPLGSDEADLPPGMVVKTGTLTYRVRAPDGSVPPGALVGYETGRGPRLVPVNPEGVRTLTDVPLGNLMLLAQAPGYDLLRRSARIEPGITEELVLVLTPAPLGPTR